MRKIKRKLYGYLQRAYARWLSLTAFHRTALGATIAILLVWGIRDQVLDRLQEDLSAINTTLSDKGVPLVVPALEDDNDVQEYQQIIENLETGLAQVKEEEEQAIKTRPPLESQQKNEAIALMADLISTSGVRLLGIEELAVDTPGAMPISRHAFTLSGSFQRVYAFLDKVRGFQYPCKIEEVALSLAEEEEGRRITGKGPLLTLSFNLRLFYYDVS